jgi:AmmeMemoRadiSam system protein A
MLTPIDAPPELPAAVTLPEEARHCLLDLARTAVAVASRARSPEALEDAFACETGVELYAAAFVTLTQAGGLRGCMGMLDPTRLVSESVLEAAACAARTDPRFPPVRPAELEGIEIEVSVLGPLVRLADPLSFRLGIDGIVVERDGHRGLLLPEVAPMVDFDRFEMLEIACRKAGLPSRAWRDPRTIVSAFRTDRFGGPAVPASTPAGGEPSHS